MIPWHAGAATKEFPIPDGTRLAGYEARTGNSTGTLDPIAISAVSLGVDSETLTILTADIVAMDAELCDRITEEAQIDRSSLLSAATHTHSGPAGICLPLHPANALDVDETLRERFVKTCAEVIQSSSESATAASVRIGQATVDSLSSDRNFPNRSTSSRLTTIAITSLSGEQIAIIVHWPCHPTILGSDNMRISADFPGALRAQLSSNRPKQSVLYLNGAAGDISTRFTRKAQSLAEVDRVGSLLAKSAVESLERSVELTATIAHRSSIVSLEYWTDADIECELTAVVAAETGYSGFAHADSRVDATRHQGADLLRRFRDMESRSRDGAIRIDAWRIGDHALLTVPGELTSELGQCIERESPVPVIVVGYAGGYAGYLPDRVLYTEHTYESLASPWRIGSGEKIAAAAVALLNELA